MGRGHLDIDTSAIINASHYLVDFGILMAGLFPFIAAEASLILFKLFFITCYY